MTGHPTVAAIVVSYHTGPRLKECLYALRADPDISELIIIDSGNPKADEAWLDVFAAASPHVRLVRDGTNPGFGAGVNKGVGLAGAEHVLIINPDAVLKRGAVRPLQAVLETAPSPAIAGGRIFNLQGMEERGGRRHVLTLARAMGFQPWTMENDPEPGGPLPVGAVSGAFFLMRRSDYLTLGGFDEAYFMHVEDVDLCRRAIAAGGAVIYVPAAGALHYTSTSDVPSGFVLEHKIRSLKYYFRKFANGWLGRAWTECVLLLLGPAMRLRR